MRPRRLKGVSAACHEHIDRSRRSAHQRPVAEMFGTRYMATLFGISFVMHQAGFSLAAWGGRVIFTATGSCDACPRSTNESLARRYAFIVASEISVLKERA